SIVLSGGRANALGLAEQLGFPLREGLDSRDVALFGLLVTLDEALSRRIRDDPRQQSDGADRVVVARDRVLHLVGVAVGVEDRDDRDTKLLGLVDREVLLLGVDNPDRRRGLRQVADTAKRLVQLVELTLLDEELLLGEALRGVVEVELLELLHAS